MSVAPNAGVVDLDTFLPPSPGQDGVQGQVPKPLAGQQDYVLTASGWVPLSALGTLVYQGTWDASTNTPTLTSSVGTNGYYYVVSVAGNTDLNGITTWTVGDWALFNGNVWQKIEGGSTVDITGGQINNTVIGNNVPAAGTFTTLTATGQTSLGGAAGAEGLRVLTTASAVQRVVAKGNVSGSSGVYIGAASDVNTDVALIVGAQGTSSIRFSTSRAADTTLGSDQLRVSHTTSAVNYVQVTGAATGARPTISAQGSDANVGLTYNAKGSANHFFQTGGLNSFSITNVASQVNWLQASASATGFGLQFSAVGSDTNISQVFQSKGTGAIDLAAGSSGVNISNGGTVTALTRTNPGTSIFTVLPTVTISAPTTAGGTQATATVSVYAGTATIVSGGTGYTLNDTITLVGGTGTAGTYTVSSVTAGVITAVTPINFGQYTVLPASPTAVAVTGGTGTGATLNVQWQLGTIWNITNAGSGYVEQPTVTISGQASGSGAAAYATVGSGTVVKSLGGFSDISVDTTPILHLRAKNTSGGNPTNATAAFGMIPPQSNFGAPILGAVSAPYFIWSGTGTSQFMSAAATPQTSGNTGSTQFAIAHTTSAVNYVQVTGAATGGKARISTAGSDATAGLTFDSKGSGSFFFTTNVNSVPNFSIFPIDAPVNYFQVTGSKTGISPTFTVLGTDTNISQVFQSKGTGAIDLAAGSRGVNISNGGTVTAVTVTANGASYTSIPSVAITAPTTAGGVQAVGTANVRATAITIQAGGTGYTVNDVLTVVGGTFVAAAMTITVTSVSAGVVTGVSITTNTQYSALPTNPVSVTGGTGSGATFNITTWQVGSVTVGTAGSGYVEQPTVSFSGGGGSGAAAYATVGSGTVVRSLGSTLSFYTPGGEAVRVIEPGGTLVNYLQFRGNTTTNAPIIRSAGSDTNIGLVLSSQATGSLQFYTNNVTQLQLAVTHTASAVNYVQVTGAATGGPPVISAQGSDSTVAMLYVAKGGQDHRFFSNTGNAEQFRVLHTAGTMVNHGYATGAAAGASPVFGVRGSDTNIDLTLTPKGTGVVQFGTLTANADAPITGYITIRDAGGTLRKLAVIA